MVKQTDHEDSGDLDLTVTEADTAEMDSEFWNAYRALDREALFAETLEHLRISGQPLTIRALAQALPPTHDLETLSYWLAMARQAGIAIDDQDETVELFDEDHGWTRFHLPTVQLSHGSLADLEPGSLE